MKTAHPFSQRITYDTGRIGTQFVFPGVVGNYLSVPDSAALDVVGDLEIVARLGLDDWDSAAFQGIVTKANDVPTGVASQRAYFLRHTAGRVFQFLWSSNGSALTTEQFTAHPLWALGQLVWTRVRFDVNDGLGNHVVTLEYSTADTVTEPTSWTLHQTRTVAGIAAMTATTAGVFIGSDHITRWFDGRISRLIIRNGIAGTTVLDVDERNTIDSAATSFTASTGQTVTEVGSVLGAEVTGLLPHQLAETHQERTFAPTYRGPR